MPTMTRPREPPQRHHPAAAAAGGGGGEGGSGGKAGTDVLTKDHKGQDGPHLSEQYTAFMTGDRAILLVVGDSDLLSTAEDMLVSRQWQYYDANHAMIPVVIDLEQAAVPTSRVVEQALVKHGYTAAEVEALREGHPGLVLFFKNWRAADHCTNIYVQNELDHWGSLHGSAPKVVFLVDKAEVQAALTPETKGEAPATGGVAGAAASVDQWKLPPVLHPRLLGADVEGPIVLYFLPCDMAGEPMPTAFQMLLLSGRADTPPPALPSVTFAEAKAPTATATQGKGKAEESKEEESVVDLDAIKERCLDSLHKTYLKAREDLVRKQLASELAELFRAMNRVTKLTTNRHKGFISYSWPRDRSDQQKLQGRLSRLRRDMARIGLDVSLDIMDLKPGMDIDEFMRKGIDKSTAVFLIGTPDYNRRVPEPTNKVEADKVNDGDVTNVGKEYCFIRQAASERGVLVFPLWFDRGEHVTPASAFPDAFLNYPFQPVRDCSSYRYYLAALPALLNTIIPIFVDGDVPDEERQRWNKACDKFLTSLHGVEQSTSTKAVWEWFFQDIKERERREQEFQESLKQFFTNTPAEILEQLSGSRDSAAAALEANIARIRQATDVLKPESPVQQQLKQFVRVKASKTAAPKKEEEKFDLVDNVLQAVAAEDANTKPLYLLVQGGTGSGKSAFIRYLEFRLWADRDKDPSCPVPLYVPLAQTNNAETDLMSETLMSIGLDEAGIEQLKREASFVVLLDGFDELGKPVNLYRSNKLDEWQAHVVVGARSQFLQSLPEYQSLFTHATQSRVDERYILPFDQTQIEAFLERFVRGPDAQGQDAHTLHDQLSNIGGLWDLLSTPFLLHMACLCLPILESGMVPSKGLPRNISKRHLYESFVSLMHGREMWRCVTRRRVPIDVNLHVALLAFDQDLARSLFLGHSITAKLIRAEAVSDAALKIAVDGSPLRVVGVGPRVTFVHKSVLEYLAACALMSDVVSLAEGEVVPILGTRLVRNEPGLVEFAGQIVRADKEAQTRLMHVIELSKTQPHATIAAGNAATILNCARVPFSGLDLSGARLCGADMRAALLHRTNLTGADLRGVFFAEAIMTGACLDMCNMRDVEFGQLPDVDEQKDRVDLLHVTGDGPSARPMTVTRGKHINYWRTETTKGDDGSDEVAIRLLSTAPLPQDVPHGDNRFLPITFSSCRAALGTMPSDQQVDIGPVPGMEDALAILPWTIKTDSPIVVGTGWPFRNTIRICDGGEKAAMVLRDNTLAIYARDGSGSAKRIVKADVYRDLEALGVNMHHKGEIDFVKCELSPNGRYAVVFVHPLSIFGYEGEGDVELPGPMYLYDLAAPEGTAPRLLRHHNLWVACVSFLKNSTQFLSLSLDKTMCTWDLEKGEVISTIRNVNSGEHHPNLLVVSPKEKYCVTVDDTHGWSWSPHSCASLWRLSDGVRVARLVGHDVGKLGAVAFSADESLVATAGGAKTVCVYETGEGTLQVVLRGHVGGISHVQFLSNSNLLSTSGKSMKLWSLAQANALPAITYTPNATEVTASEGCWCVQTVSDYVVGTHNVHPRRLGVWNRHTGELMPSLNGSYMDGTTRGLATAKDDKSVYIGLNSSGCLPIPRVDVEKGGAVVQELEVLRRWSPTHFHGNTLAISADFRFMVATTLWRTSLLYDLEQGKLLGTLDGHTHDHVWNAMLSPSGKYAATTASDGKLIVFDVSTRKPTCNLPSKDIEFGFNCKDQLVVVEKGSKTVKTYDVSGASPAEVGAANTSFASADQLGMAYVCSRTHAVLCERNGTTLTLRNIDNFEVEAVVESFFSGLGTPIISQDWKQLLCQKTGLAGLDVYGLDKGGSKLQWVTRPTFVTNSSTSVVGCVGLPSAARQLLAQLGAKMAAE